MECTARSSVIDIKLVEQIGIKHKNVGINKTIIVAREGFSESAKSFAKKNDIDLLTFGKAISQDWPEYLDGFRQVTLFHRQYRLNGLAVTLKGDELERGFFLSSETIVIEPSGGTTLVDYFFNEFKKSKNNSLIPPEYIDPDNSPDCESFAFSWRLDPPFRIRDKNNMEADCVEVITNIVVNTSSKIVSGKFDKYAGRDVVFGEVGGFGPIQDAKIIITSNEDKKFSLLIDIETDESLSK